MPIIKTNEFTIYFERKGKGDPLLIISGTNGDLRNEPNFFDTPLVSSFDLICYDQRGLGQSSEPSGQYTMADYADDASKLLNKLQLDKVLVMGLSFGGMVAQEFAIRYPRLISKLVLACTSTGGEGGASYPLHNLTNLSNKKRAEIMREIFDTRHGNKWAFENPNEWTVIQKLASDFGERRITKGLAKQLQARKAHNTFQKLSNLKMPVLLVGGRYDGMTPMSNMLVMHDKIANSSLTLFEGGHFFLTQDKNAYPFIIKWLNQR